MRRFPKAVRLVCTLATIGVALPMSGCSDLLYIVGLEPTGHRLDGRYTPFPAERSYECVELRTQIVSEEDSLVGAHQRALDQFKSGSATIGTWFWRKTSGTVSGLPAVQEFKKGDARLAALEELWREKGCPERERSPAVRDTAAKLAKLIEQHETKPGQ